MKATWEVGLQTDASRCYDWLKENVKVFEVRSSAADLSVRRSRMGLRVKHLDD